MSSSNHNNQSQQNKDLVFFVRVQYRCNSSWQGTVQWLDGKQQVIFRSALELGHLINSAKSKKTSSKDELARRWDDKEIVS